MARLISTLDHLCCTTVFYVTVLWINPGGMGKEERKSKSKRFNKQGGLISKGEVEEKKTSGAKAVTHHIL